MMKESIFRPLFLVVLASLLQGCTKTQEPQNNIPIGEVMRFEVPSPDIQTRSGYDNDNINTKMLYIWTATQGEAAGSPFNFNGYIHYVDSEWITAIKWNGRECYYTDCTQFWKDSQTPVDITVATFAQVDPNGYVGSLSQYELLSVSGSQFFDYYIIWRDYLFFKGTVNPALTSDVSSEGVITEYARVNGKIRLPMNHICSKVIVTLTYGTEFSVEGGAGRAETSPIKYNYVYAKGTYIYDHFNMETGTFLGDFKDWDDKPSELVNITMHPISYTPATSAQTQATATYEALLIPQSVAEGVFQISFTIGDKTYTWTSPDALTFESGIQYTINLSVGGNVVDGASLVKGHKFTTSSES